MVGNATSSDDRRGQELVRLLETAVDPEAKRVALEALAATTVWLATWAPHAEGFRTLINGSGEEALAAFSSEQALLAAAERFDWLQTDGTVSMHESLGADILRHAWTREYAFVVVDVGLGHSVEYDREAVRRTLRELDRTGPFRTSRPPAASEVDAPTSSFAPPVDRVSTTYSMAPSHEELIERLSELPTKPHKVPDESEPPTRPMHKPEPRRESVERATSVQEILLDSARIEVAGTYGAASLTPRRAQRSDGSFGDSSVTNEASLTLPSDTPTAPGARTSDLQIEAKVPLPPIAPNGLPSMKPPTPEGPVRELGAQGEDLEAAVDLTSQERTEPWGATDSVPPPFDPDVEPETNPLASPLIDGESDKPAAGATPNPEPNAAPTVRAPATSIGDAIALRQMLYPPPEALLATLTAVLRGYPEVEWASYCEVERLAGSSSPAVCLRLDDSYRDNVTAIIKELCEASRTQEVEIDVLLMDGHDLLRKARERAFVFFPWKPKAFGS